MTSTEGVQYSEDGYYWWDDSSQEWKPLDESHPGPSGQGGTGGTDGTDGQQGGGQEHPIDWSQFPTLWTLASSSDVNDHYQKIGIDPQSLMAGGEGSEHETEEQPA